MGRYKTELLKRCKGAFHDNYIQMSVVAFCISGIGLGCFSSPDLLPLLYFLAEIIWSIQKYLSVRACVVEKPVN